MRYSGNRNAFGAINNNFMGMGASGAALQNAQMAQTAASDTNMAETISAQTGAEITKSNAQNIQIQNETNTKINEMFRDSNLNRCKTCSKIQDSWVQQMQV